MIDIGRLESGGVNTDVPPYRLAPMVFNEVLNVDFENGGVVPAVKEIGAFGGTEGTPVHMEEVEGPSNQFNFLYFLTDRAFVWSGGAFYEVSNPDGMGASTDLNRWNGGFFHGWWIWTNGDDVPQQWNPQVPYDPMQDLENWPPEIRIRFLRPYLNFLVGFSYTSEELGFSKQTIFWSDQADPGTLPKWDITDPSQKAGVYSLTADSDPIEGAMELRGEMFIYKRSSVWAMRYVGGTFVMNVAPRFSERGLLNSRCVVALEGAHFCLDRAGFYIHNGVTVTPIGDGVIWEKFSDFFSDVTIPFVFMEYEESKGRVWIFYSTKDLNIADRVLIYDLFRKIWTFRSVQQATCSVRGTMKRVGSTLPWDSFLGLWSDDVFTWGSDTTIWEDPVTWDNSPLLTTWDDTVIGGAQRSIHYASYIDPALRTFDPINNVSTAGDVTWPGSTQYPPIWYIGKSGRRLAGFLQRIGFCFLERDGTGDVFVDQTVYKHLTEMYLDLDNGALEVRIGTHSSLNGPIEWGDWVFFDPLIDTKLDPHCINKYLAFEFRGLEDVPYRWKLSGISLNVQNGGRY